jgi:hypothetical protein
MRRNGFSFHAERSTRFVQRSTKRGLSPTGDRHTAVSCFSKTKKEELCRQGHFFLRFRLNCTRCISIAPAMLDRYLAALPAMSLIPFAPFFTADFVAPR